MDLVPISRILAPRSDHDRAMIGPQSGHDRASIVVLGLSQSSSDQVGAIPQQKACDRGSIAVDRTAIVGIFHAWSAPSDDAPAGWTIAIGLIPCAAIVRRIHRWPSDGAVIKPRWRSVISGASTCHQVSLLITSLMPNF